MPTSDKFGIVIIDGAVPRSEKERCEVLYNFLNTVNFQRAERQGYKLELEGDDGPTTGGEWSELEDEIISDIADSSYVVSIGEHCPGDVIVWRTADVGESELPGGVNDPRYVEVDAPPGWRLDTISGAMYYSETWL